MVNFQLESISEYRTPLMGIATICILLTHAPVYGVELPSCLHSLLSAAQIGVMVFFLLSGVGLYYSLQSVEYNKGNIVEWYKKRFTRLFLPYLFIYVPFCALTCYIHREGVIIFFFDISTLSFWFGRHTCWFVNMLVPLYIISPIWYKLIKIKYSIIPTFIAFCLCLPQNGYWIQASVFFWGFWLAKYIKKRICLKFDHLIILFSCVLLLLVAYYVYDIGYLLLYLLTPFVIMSCFFIKKIQKTPFYGILQFFGKISLESYLFNITIYSWINYFNLLPDDLFQYRYIYVVVFGTILAYFINVLCTFLVKKHKTIIKDKIQSI